MRFNKSSGDFLQFTKAQTGLPIEDITTVFEDYIGDATLPVRKAGSNNSLTVPIPSPVIPPIRFMYKKRTGKIASKLL